MAVSGEAQVHYGQIHVESCGGGVDGRCFCSPATTPAMSASRLLKETGSTAGYWHAFANRLS